MAVAITRSIGELRAECDARGISWTPLETRTMLADKLRGKLAGEEAARLADPMKAKDLKHLVAWGSPRPFAGLGAYLDEKKYAAEVKLDGARVTLVIGAEGSKIYSGRRSVRTFAASDRTANFPALAAAAAPGLAGTVVDAELLAPSAVIKSPTGNVTASLLSASVSLMNSRPAGAHAIQRAHGNARLVAFDVTAVSGADVMAMPYTRRRELLAAVVDVLRALHPESGIEIVERVRPSAASIQRVIDDGHEGVVLKALDSVYKPGSRSGGWFKIKKMSTADGFVTGWKPGENANAGKVGSLELSVYGPDGNPVAVAQVGNLTEELRAAVTAPDGSLKKEFYGAVIEFMGQSLTKESKVRHPHMLRLRPDKGPEDCLWDQVDGVFSRD